MRQSKDSEKKGPPEIFTKTRKEAPKDEVAKNAQLFIRAGYIDKLAAGVYTYLPLGLRVLKKIEAIIRDEMNKVGGQEILMPTLHPKDLWEKTGRWKTMDDLYKVMDTSGREVALGPTHEEVVTPLVGSFISSYRDLPIYVYQFQNKFRMELRAKSGILRGREFLMKDFYSFHRDETDLNTYYEVMKEAYVRVFARVGIGERTYLTFASGGSFSAYSHEFQMETNAGEDLIYYDPTKRIAVNKEVYTDEVLRDLGLEREKLIEKKTIEVGNIFKLRTKFSDAFELSYKDEEGKKRSVEMGCYGIGLGRLMGAVVEALADDRGIVWPDAIAPFRYHIVRLGAGDKKVNEFADMFYEDMKKYHGDEILYDDRETVNAGEKFADSDLIGIPTRIVISRKTLETGKFEVVRRTETTPRLVSREELLGR